MSQRTERGRQLEYIDDLLQQALELGKDQRPAFLDEVCADDAELRCELDELLNEEVETGEFLRRAPQLARMHDQTQAPLTGRLIGRYRIAECVGRGGMGEVYRAEDLELEREAALKILPPEFTAEPERVRRFTQEAIAVSRLNHPNILTVYELVHAEEAHFIAAEFVRGKTLRQLLTDPATNQPRPLTPTLALDIAGQIAGALSAAHAAGIVHRDIKPENVMVRTDGLVKVLDFGIAKLEEKDGEMGGQGEGEKGRWGDEGSGGRREKEGDTFDIFPSLHPSSPTLPLSPSPHPPVSPSPVSASTIPGTVLGTVRYMSPEQADARDVDHRTDLFSLGVVLYEMIAGRGPFAGENKTGIPTDTLNAILRAEPSPLNAPKPLQRIVRRALARLPEQRYQSAEELLRDLKAFQQRLERRASPGQMAWRAALIALLVLFGLATAIWNWPKANPPAPNVIRLVNTGNVQSAAISPDGRWVVYAVGRSVTNSLWLREVDIGTDRELLPATAGLEYQLLSFSPGGEAIYYVAYDPRGDRRSLYRLPLAGGAPGPVLPSLVLEAADSPAAFSPDGREFAFVRYDSARRQSDLIVAQADGRAERVLLTRRDPIKFSTQRISWSPDGQSIAYATGTFGKERDHRVYEYSLGEGKERLLSKHFWRVIEGVAWLGDRRALMLLASDPMNTEKTAWYLSLANDERRQLSAGLELKGGLSVTADGRALVSIEEHELQSLWIADAANPGQARQLLQSTEAGRRGLAWMPDGRILYVSKAGGKPSLWTMNADGSRNQRLSFGDDTNPAVSPDGRYVVFCSTEDGDHIWRMDRDGGNRRQLTFGVKDVEPICSPDGNWVVYVSRPQERQAMLRRVPMTGGAAEQLTEITTANPSPAISPDGSKLAYYHRSPQETQRKHIHIIPSAGGAPMQILDVPYSAYLLQWSPDGQSLDYVETREDIGNVWRLPLGGGKPRRLTDFKNDAISRFAWSRDGRQLLVSRALWNLDVLLLRDFQ